MAYPEDQLAELKALGTVDTADELGITWIRIRGLQLPTGCTPAAVDALLCPVPYQGYDSRLFFSVQISSRVGRNWNGGAHVLGTTWFAYSWKVAAGGKRLAQLVAEHLEALR